MKHIHREPITEEGKHNLILQNRCGNRLTLMVHEDRSEIECVYKPNASRRKDFRARNFSNRDNQTELFRSLVLPDLRASYIQDFGYDPYVTRIRITAPSLAANTIALLNIVGENVFALSATHPLTLCIRPRQAFRCSDGLLVEAFEDRGEAILAFIAFEGFEANRYRVTEDGTHVLQICEGEVLLLGGEESESRMAAALQGLRGRSIEALIEQGEARLAPVFRKGQIRFRDPDFPRVIDFNKRIIHSGMDEGGACFGALNRIYYLIWNRDGSQTAAMAARSGWPDLLRVWAPFILANPSVRRGPDGQPVAEWLQMLGTRWTKAEDDGIYYAFASLFALLQTTGEDHLLDACDFDRLLDSLDHTVATRFDPAEGLFGSDVRGEADLRTSPNYGYDAVNGTMLHGAENPHDGLPAFARAYGLYHNTNLYNALRMAAVLIDAVPHRHDRARRDRYLDLAERLAGTIRNRYVDARGIFHADYVRLLDGTMRWIAFTDTDYSPDHWEYAWAVSVGPFFPDLPAAIRSAGHVRDTWPSLKPYGYCPWNTLSRMLKEYGLLENAGFREMLSDEVREARMLSTKYPMRDALTEYHGWTEGWRPLPFSAGSFLWTATSLLLQSLPRGLAVRASDLVDQVRDFHHHSARIDVDAEGEGDTVRSWSLNGVEVPGSLQIPENLLRAGRNHLRVIRGEAPARPRLHGSDARLLAAEADGRLRFETAGPAQLVLENAGGIEVRAIGAGGPLPVERAPLPGTSLELYRVAAEGWFTLTPGPAPSH